MRAHEAYKELVQRVREAALLGACSDLLGWDEETYLPRRGVEHRGNQTALLAGLYHDRATHPRIGELLAVVEGSDLVSDPLSPPAVNVRELRREYNRDTHVPRALVEDLARTTTLAQQVWVEALHKADWNLYCPWVEKVVKLKCQEAAALCADGGSVQPALPYDALLDEYEPGITTQQIASLFNALREELTRLTAEMSASRHRPDVTILERAYPIDRQRPFGETVAAAVGFDFRRGRLDTSPHPFFTTLGPDDCRITTRFNLNQFSDGYFGILHEVGHALYEQGLDPAHFGLPLGEAASLGLHESQARLWENTVGRSRAFWRHFFPQAVQAFPGALRDVSEEQFHRAVNHVAPTLIRVRADEVTYNLHILIRFELEQALVAGDLRAADLPAVWNEKYKRYLNVAPANDAEGCLQDGHWGAGLIGYFPTYTLGNLFAAQLFARAAEDLGGVENDFAHGRFEGLLGWLRDRVYRQGHRYPSARLIEQATGSPPDHRPFLSGLRSKYSELYQL